MIYRKTPQALRVLSITCLLLIAQGCSKDSNSSLTGPTGSTSDGYNIERTLADDAQRNTIAFDGLAFLTNNLGAQSFLPPGKVADFSGFQYLRDNDPTQLGHNTDFVTIVAFNVLHILSSDQLNQMVARAQDQVTLINQYAYQRFPLMKAFRRQIEGDLPVGTTGLSHMAVMNYSADLYAIDGQISYDRAKLMGGIIRSFTTAQRSALDSLKRLGGVGNWNRSLPDPLQGLNLPQDVNVAVMTYASEMYSWYAGSVDADVYFCPERQGTYFGSFFLKDWPAMGNPNYTINEQLTASAGESFLRVLPDAQKELVTGLVELQRDDLNAIVAKRRGISMQLRRFMTEETIDSAAVISLSRQYGELDGEIVYYYATRFASVAQALSSNQRSQITALADSLGYMDPTGAFLYSEPITMPDIISTDFLFSEAGSSAFTLSSPEVAESDTLPADYTCDGEGATLPLQWSGAPATTQSFTLIMHHVDPESEIKWYWILYDVPSSVTTLPRNVTGIGVHGTNSVNGDTAYAPPCSQGPGPKTYTLTVYALSSAPDITVPRTDVNREVLLAAMSDRTLASSQLNVIYSRP